MMIARATSDDGKTEVLLLGLSRVNVERLMQGKPIRIAQETHGEGIPEGWKILILFGETENDMREELRAAGVIDAQTKETTDPRLNNERN